MKPVKFYLYVRKSTEDEEKQVMSIEAQLTELKEFAHREGIKILETFTESKSAKTPGREMFNRMIEKIYNSKEPVGILAWHPDRLARNSVDGGQIIYLTDMKKIGALRFPTFWFEPTPQGLFMLQVTFGQSKYYSDNLAENVRRGIRQKLRRGEYLGLAPYGYVNNSKTRNIEPDPVKSKVIQQAYKEFADGKHSLVSMSERLSFWGLVSNKGTMLGKAAVHRILTNPTYIGLMKIKGELHEGKYEPIIEKELFERVQKELKRKAKPRRQKDGHIFPFTGLMKCGECGGAITAQYAKKGRYIYYRCAKRMGIKCSQPYISDLSLLSQLQEELLKISIPQDWADYLLKEIERLHQEDVKGQRSFCQNTEQQIHEVEEKLDKLVGSFLDGDIEKDNYLKKKEELLKRKIDLQTRLKDFGKKGVAWFELAKDFVNSAHQAEKLAGFGSDFFEIKSFFKKNGLNCQLRDKKLLVNFVEPFYLLPKYRALQPVGVAVNKKEPLLSLAGVPCGTPDGT